VTTIDWTIVGSAATVFASIFTAIGVAFCAWQIRLGKKQSQAEFEDSLDQQYREISMALPVDVLIGKDASEDQKSQVRELIYNYFDLANEQAYLRAKGRICKTTWLSWSTGMEMHLSRPAFSIVYDEVIEASSFTYLKRLVDARFKSDPRIWFKPKYLFF
jgi:hypothetical protein